MFEYVPCVGAFICECVCLIMENRILSVQICDQMGTNDFARDYFYSTRKR